MEAYPAAESVGAKGAEPVGVTVKDTMAQMDWLSDRISTQVRWFAAGVVALVWGLLLTPPTSVRPWHAALISVGLLAVSVLFFDFLQYAAGYLSVRRLHRAILGAPDQRVAGYDPNDPWYRARTGLFWIKQGFAVATFVGLLVALLPGLH